MRIAEIKEDVKYVDHLEEDAPLGGQKFVCLSIVSPAYDQKCDVSGFKVRGVYETEEEARKRASYLQKIDPLFNIYISKVGVWLPVCDNPEKVEDSEYQNEQLNSIVKGYKENQQKQKEVFEDHKRQQKEEALKMNTAEYKFERSKLDLKNCYDQLKSTAEKTSDLNKLIASLKESLLNDYGYDADAEEAKLLEESQKLDSIKEVENTEESV